MRGKTAAHGATATNQLVNVADFFDSQVRGMHECVLFGSTCAARQTQQIMRTATLLIALNLQVVPELRSGPGGQPILQADALKFVITFRSQLSKAAILAAFPLLVALLRSESNVVHSYAAILIERLLTSKASSGNQQHSKWSPAS